MLKEWIPLHEIYHYQKKYGNVRKVVVKHTGTAGFTYGSKNKEYITILKQYSE